LSKQVSETTAQSGDLLTYSLQMNVTGNNASSVVVTDILPPNVTFTGFVSDPAGSTAQYNSAVSLLTWTLPSPLPPGTYSFVYQTKVNDFVKGGSVLTNNAKASYSGGPAATASVNVTVIGQFTVRIGVYNEAGELIKVILVQQYSQPIENISLPSGNAITSLHGADNSVSIFYGGTFIAAWDGSDQKGDPVSNGTYHIKVDNVDNMGIVTNTTLQVSVSRKLYQSTILIYNEAGEVVKHLYAYVDDPGKAGVAGMQLSSSTLQAGSGQGGGPPSTITITLNNGTTVVWDGTSDGGSYVQSGQYLIEAHTIDGSGSDSTVTKEVMVQDRNAARGAGVVTAWPNILKASSGTMGVTFHSDSIQPLKLRVSLYTIAGERIPVASIVPGPNQVSLDASDLASGMYIAVVELTDAKGIALGRQMLKLAVIH